MPTRPFIEWLTRIYNNISNAIDVDYSEYVKGLHMYGKTYHFDDLAFDIVDRDDNRIFTDEEAIMVDVCTAALKCDEMYDLANELICSNNG